MKESAPQIHWRSVACLVLGETRTWELSGAALPLIYDSFGRSIKDDACQCPSYLERTMKAIALLTFLALGSGSAAEEYRCSYEQKLECARTGCESGDLGSSYLLIPHPDSLVAATASSGNGRPLPQIRRCDATGCSALEVVVVTCGMFVNISTLTGGYYLKVVRHGMGALKAGMFMESASSFLLSVNYWGTCAARGW